ncbi:hypothetical protein E5206_11200 [Arthrobacter sp. PAMC25564]|uniref:hypothetical protein n=1 Tax=Arthrobacter sp. PAMC25564 TaxID=2565366 RepID=UPI0010A21368|nr:hypothetical protein [Arthrobacter sp. PAMC25564]QCB97413.1 hypothetical protein E5206_11200 [Arthrobacter sp. PAMC25564]
MDVFRLGFPRWFDREVRYSYQDGDVMPFVLFSKAITALAALDAWRPHVIRCNAPGLLSEGSGDLLNPRTGVWDTGRLAGVLTGPTLPQQRLSVRPARRPAPMSHRRRPRGQRQGGLRRRRSGQPSSAEEVEKAARDAQAHGFVQGCPVLVLDEPTTGLDARSEDAVMRALREVTTGRTTVIITHRIAAAMARLCGRQCSAPASTCTSSGTQRNV